MSLNNTWLIGLNGQIQYFWCMIGIIFFYCCYNNASKSLNVKHIVFSEILHQLLAYGILTQRLCTSSTLTETRYCQEVCLATQDEFG